jgi:hypothetical protein
MGLLVGVVSSVYQTMIMIGVVMASAVIVDALRSPMGKGKVGGALSGVHPVDLLAQTIAGLV